MKTNYTLLKTIVVTLFFTYTSWSQATIAQWNFNGASATEVAGGTASPLVSVGAGTAQLVGATSAIFASGISNGGSSDPVITSPNNFAWGTTNYAPLGTENKQRGIQVNVSTVGFADISFTFDQRLSNSSNSTYIVQYTTDNQASVPAWIDAQTFTLEQSTTAGDTWYNLRTVDMSSVSELDNNPNVAFRIVSAFNPNTGDYFATETTYATTGTSRFDMITVTAATTLGTTSFESAKNNFKMFPNPSNKGVVQFNEAQEVSVFDILGKLILKSKNTTTIDTKSFRSGVYLVKTKTGITRKLIVR